MLARRPTYKLPNLNAAGDRFLAPEAVPLPASPLERNPLSPKGWKKRDSDGVGLSIVAKLDSSAVCCGGAVRRRKILVSTGTVPIAIGSSWAAEAGISGKPAGTAGRDFPVADFLSCCYLCRKRLQGKDIFMYRGEKAFCSEECRYQQISSDECLEKWRPEVLRRADVSSSPCSGEGGGDQGGRLFFAGIAAA